MALHLTEICRREDSSTSRATKGVVERGGRGAVCSAVQRSGLTHGGWLLLDDVMAVCVLTA